MTFEEQLTRAFDTLTERLRGDIGLQVQRTAAELIAAGPPARDPLTSGMQPPAEEIDIVVAAARREAYAEGVAAGRERSRREAPEEGAPRTADAGSPDRLVDAVRSIERARSLTAVLDAIVSGAYAEAAHVVVWLIRAGQLHQWRRPEAGDAESGPAPIVAEAARTNAVASSEGTVAVPIALAGHVVAVLFADSGEPGTANREPRTVNLEVLARYAARSLEALTAFKIARALTERPAAPGDATVSQAETDAASAEEDTSARRYARLLVSEIKLYHESSVIDGRRDRDLATRLGGEIARARAMYEQRVPPDVRQRADYFRDELVRTLADGDASLLELRSES